MTVPCPDWKGLAAVRDAGGEAPGWGEALAHFDACTRCRDAALASDPTLLFRRLPSPSTSADDVERMRREVAVLRRAGAVAGPLRRRRFGLQSAAAAVLVVASGFAAGHGRLDAPFPSASATTLPELAAEPLVEPLEARYDQVLQVRDGDFSLVVLVDDRLDV